MFNISKGCRSQHHRLYHSGDGIVTGLLSELQVRDLIYLHHLSSAYDIIICKYYSLTLQLKTSTQDRIVLILQLQREKTEINFVD